MPDPVDMKKLLLETLEQIEAVLQERFFREQEIKSSEEIGSARTRLERGVNALLEKAGVHCVSLKRYPDFKRILCDPFTSLSSIQTFQELIKAPDRFQSVYDLLEDEESRKTFIWFLQYRIAVTCIGIDAAALYPPPVRHESSKADVEIKKIGKDRYRVGPYTIHCTELNTLQESWIGGQYRLKGICEPLLGDWVIEGGGFQGDTTLWFSDRVGPEGKVLAFEPFEENYKILIENVQKNNIKNVIPVPKALHRKSGMFSMTGRDGGATLTMGNSSKLIEAISIDEYVYLLNCPRIDFIKMDIEGTEVEALMGGIETIRAFLPKLAISIYHKGTDILDLLEFIKNINQQYKLFIRHYSNTIGETVMYAVVC